MFGWARRWLYGALGLVRPSHHTFSLAIMSLILAHAVMTSLGHWPWSWVAIKLARHRGYKLRVESHLGTVFAENGWRSCRWIALCVLWVIRFASQFPYRLYSHIVAAIGRIRLSHSLRRMLTVELAHCFVCIQAVFPVRLLLCKTLAYRHITKVSNSLNWAFELRFIFAFTVMSHCLWCDFTNNNRLMLRILSLFRDRLLANNYGAAIILWSIVNIIFNSAINCCLCLIGITRVISNWLHENCSLRACVTLGGHLDGRKPTGAISALVTACITRHWLNCLVFQKVLQVNITIGLIISSVACFFLDNSHSIRGLCQEGILSRCLCMLYQVHTCIAAGLVFVRQCGGILLVRHEKALWITTRCCFCNTACWWPAFIAIIRDCRGILNINGCRLMRSLNSWEALAGSTICPRFVTPCRLVLLLIIVFSGWTYSALGHFCYYSLLLQMSIVEQALSAAFFHSILIILVRQWSWMRWGF